MNAFHNKSSAKSLQILGSGLVLRLLDVILVILSVIITNFVFNLTYLKAYDTNLITWIVTFAFYFFIFGEIFELYQQNKINDYYFTIRSGFLTTLFTTIFYVFTPKITPFLPQSRIEIILLFLSITTVLLVWRWFYNQVFRHPIFLKNVLIIASDKELIKCYNLINEFSNEYKIIGYVSANPIENFTEDVLWFDVKQHSIQAIVTQEKISTLLVSDIFDKEFSVQLSAQLIELFKKGLIIIAINDFIEQLTKRIAKNRLNASFYNYFTYSKYHQDSLYIGLIKIFDIIAAIVGLGFLGGLIPFIYLTNLLLNKGPLFYTQIRIGINGNPFKIFKLRTMVVGAENSTALWATKDDIRATFFGKWLRKTRIDEMPQFWNVLIGDMNMIGPRPERPEFVEMLEKKLPFYALRTVIKPGLTGWAQVEYPYANTVEDQEMKLRYDLYYIKERTALMDLRILLKTINTILFHKGY